MRAVTKLGSEDAMPVPAAGFSIFGDFLSTDAEGSVRAWKGRLP